MGKLFRRWCERNPNRAHEMGESLRLWLAYLGLVAFGGALVGYAVYSWAEARRIEAQAAHTVQLQRMQDSTRQLLLIIEKRMPAIAEVAEAAAETASGAAVTAKAAAVVAKQAAGAAGTAGRTANSAASTAKHAASQAGQAARKVDEAVTPRPLPPRQDPDEWLK